MSKKDDGDEKKGGKKANGKSDVGYCRPPQHTQWKKGQSGNRYGRPKRDLGLKSVFHKEMARTVDVKVGGKTRKVTMLQAVMIQVSAQAMKGDPKARDIVFALWREYPPPDCTGRIFHVTDEEYKAMEELAAVADQYRQEKFADLGDENDLDSDELDEDAPEEEPDRQDGDAHAPEDTPAEADGEEAGGSGEPKRTQRG